MNRSLGVYLATYSLSLLGNGIASVLFPLLVLARTGDILAAGIVASATTAASAVIGVLAGVVVDRFNRRTVSIVSDVLSAGSIAALPLVDLLVGLDLTWFLVLGILGAFGDMPGMTARETLLPRLVRLSGARPGTLDRIVGWRESLSGALLIAGPGLGGLLVWLLGTSSATLLITAGLSLSAAALSFALPRAAGQVTRTPEPGTTAVGRAWSDLLTGWRFLLRTPLLLAATGLSAVIVAVIASLQSTVLPAYFTAEGLPQLSGMAITGIALGGLISAGVYATTVGRVSRRTWLVIGLLGTTAGFAVLGSMAGPAAVLGGAVIVGLAHGPMAAALGVATIEATPDALRGRVLGAQNAIVLAAPALTAAPIAALATGFGLVTAGIVIAAAMALCSVLALLAPALRNVDTVRAGNIEEEITP